MTTRMRKVKLEIKLVKLAFLSPMHPLTTAKDSGSELILQVKKQGVSVFLLFLLSLTSTDLVKSQ